MNDKVSQTQKGGAESTNVQAAQVVIHQYGLSFDEVKKIALEVYKSNFVQLSAVARDTARARAEEITDHFLNELLKKNSAGLEQAESPNFQLNLLTVQKEYARSGDKDLGKLLVDLLIDITKEKDRTVLQIVLQECLTVAPKLTVEQVAVLAVIFLLRYCGHARCLSVNEFREYMKLTASFVNSLSKKDTTFRHLEYSGCGSLSFGGVSITRLLGAGYPALFSAPFSSEELQFNLPEIVGSDLVMPSCVEAGKLQFAIANDMALDAKLAELGADTPLSIKIKSFWDARRLPHHHVREKALEWAPEMQQIFDAWENSSMKNFTLTSVGLGIAHAAVRSRTGFASGLSVWIN